MRADLVERFVEVEVLLLAPICPHWAEHIWRNVLGRRTSIQRVRTVQTHKQIGQGSLWLLQRTRW